MCMPLNLVSSYKVFSARRVSILTRNPNIGFPSVRPSVQYWLFCRNKCSAGQIFLRPHHLCWQRLTCRGTLTRDLLGDSQKKKQTERRRLPMYRMVRFRSASVYGQLAWPKVSRPRTVYDTYLGSSKIARSVVELNPAGAPVSADVNDVPAT